MNAILRTLGLVVGIPTLLASIYFGLIASDIYVSESRFAIRSAKGGAAISGLAAVLASPAATGSGQESLVVIDYVHSADLLKRVQDTLDVREHFSADGVDVLSRLERDASAEAMLEYFQKHVDLLHDSTSGVVTIKVKAYDPVMAKAIGELIISLSEELVNDMSFRMESDALQAAHSEVDRALQKVRAASTDMTSFRNMNTSLNPTSESSALLTMVAGLETRLIETQTELSEKMAFMREDAPAVVSLKNRINALTRQLKLEKGRVAGGNGQEMSALIEDYQPLVLEQELAQQQYASALSSLELARIEAQRKKQYLVTFIKPGLPDEATEPQRFYKVLTVMIFSLLAYAIGGLIWSAVKDHVGR